MLVRECGVHNDGDQRGPKNEKTGRVLDARSCKKVVVNERPQHSEGCDTGEYPRYDPFNSPA